MSFNNYPQESTNSSYNYMGIDTMQSNRSFYDPHNKHFEEFLIDWKKSQPDNCCICLDSYPGINNDLIFCASPSCDVCIHQECYGVKTSPASDEAWYCDRCSSVDALTATCKLCPVKRGALKRLVDGSAWVHVVCALWWPQVKVDDSNGLQIISINDIPPESFQKRCDLCENSNVATVGACVKCDKPGCNKMFHITCAQDWDLLVESTDNTKLSPGQEPYYVYCKEHSHNSVPSMNAWTLWSRKKDIYYETLCQSNMQLVESVQARERPLNFTRDRRKSIQFNGFTLPPITSFNEFNNLILETSQQEKNGNSIDPTSLITKFEKTYNIYNQERSEFMKATKQVHSRQLFLVDNLNQKAFLSAQKASKLQKEQQDLEQENRNLQLEVSELKYGLLNLCSLKGLRMIQKLMGRPRHGLEFYPHQDMILDYFLEVSQQINQLNKEDKNTLLPRSCICGICSYIVDFSVSTIACSVCGSWYHIPCLPLNNRPNDCASIFMCLPCHNSDLSKSNNNQVQDSKQLQLSITQPDSNNTNLRAKSHNSASPYIGAQPAKKRANDTNNLNIQNQKNTRLNSSVEPSVASPAISNKQDTKATEDKPPAPYQQSPRFPGDEYTPRWVRGVGKSKEGLCPHCNDKEVWLKIKISAYWYHLNYQHGISSITGKKFRAPLEYRINKGTDQKEALCHKCLNWINSESPRNKPVNVEEIYWWKHAQKCHQ